MKRAIEEYFPIVEINKLAIPERNAFKPIYQMHKWFARRSSSVFRAILLGALKPAGTDIMKEFYKDHTNDIDTKDKIILDPFMGGGTTIVEALRLGCKVIGVDLNPVAWFIVKTEVEPVDIEELEKAFHRLSERKVSWSGKSVKETLLDLYKTECPGCGNKDADIIYTFWVKSAPCTTALCTAFTPLFSNYIIAGKSPSIRYFPDTVCPSCNGKFDWEKDPASLVADKKLMINSGKFSAGEGRTSSRWAYSESDNVECPWCNENVKPFPKNAKLNRKKVPLSVLNCPNCEEVWQLRGPLPEEVNCPTCDHSYKPLEGNIPGKGKFICHGTCGGNVDNIINAIRKHPANELLPVKAYAVEGYCEECAKRPGKNNSVNDTIHETLFDYSDSYDKVSHKKQDKRIEKKTKTDSFSMIWKNNGKFFKRISAKDAAKNIEASEIWRKEKDNLPYPKSEVPVGEKTKSGLIAHHYKYWYQMFNDRQLLGLSTLLKAIDEESNQVFKEMLLNAFSNSLNDNNMFCRFAQPRNHLVGVFARHDFQPKADPLEGNLFGSKYGHGGFSGYWKSVLKGKNDFNLKLHAELYNISSTNIPMEVNKVDYVISDPPYAGNVNYSELADLFYVWLRLILKNKYSNFAPEFTPKMDEIIENKTRGKSSEDFKDGLKLVFIESNRVLKDDGILAFTFHHSEGDTWESLLEAICEAGFYIEAVYPINGEAENSLHLMNKEAISYDLIHVCKKVKVIDKNIKRSWAGIRNEIRKKAREEVKLIESGRYGKGLSAPDVNILLIGKCLELYSKNYDLIVDHLDTPVPLGSALEQIKVLVDQIISKDNPFPSELSEIDTESYVYFTSLYQYKEIKSDDVNKNTKGLIETSRLRESGLIIKGREKRGRTFEVKQPLDRLNDLKIKFREFGISDQENLFGENSYFDNKGILFIDYIHLLMGLAENGEDITKWLNKFRGLRPQIRTACQYLLERGRFDKSAKSILALIDERTLFNTNTKNSKEN